MALGKQEDAPLTGLWDELAPLKSSRTYSKGTPLFVRGHPARGIFLVERGEITVTLPSGTGSGQLFQLAGPGAVLGLSEAMTGDAYKVTAEASEATRVAYVDRTDLLEFLRTHQEHCLQLVRILSEDLHSLYHRLQVMDYPGPRMRRKAHTPPVS
jgi:CRP-like cAMP-binding protein